MLVEMTIEDALKYFDGNKKEKVLVSVYNMEDQYGIASFQPKDKKDCEAIIRKAETIAKMCDDLIEGVKCFSVKQEIRSLEVCSLQNSVESVWPSG